MSKGLSYNYTGTRGHIIAIASSLPSTGQGLIAKGWQDISDPRQSKSGIFTYKEPSTGLRVRYDSPKTGAPGFAGKNHFHILNPNATGNKDRYLDEYGNPVSRGSKASHILPKGVK